MTDQGSIIEPQQDAADPNAGDQNSHDPEIASENIAPEDQWASDPGSRQRRLEAVLFLSRQPLTSRKISDLAHLEDGTQARTMIAELNGRYERAGRAFQIKRVGGGYQMLTRPHFGDWIRRLEHVPGRLRLSAPAMETLTVVAYRGPIIKAEIEAIRGVSSGEMLRQLLDHGLVKIAGRSEKLGRPFLYATTKEFLNTFGFNSVQDLPRAAQLSGSGLPAWAAVDNAEEPSKNVPHAEPFEEMFKETEQ